jgi:hypothetical protein
LHNKFHTLDSFQNTFLYDNEESTIFQKYRKSFTAEIECDIDNVPDVQSLAERMIDRFGLVRETIKIGVGYDTYAINLLDKIIFDCTITDREFSKYYTWIVKEADPGQDEIVIEGDEIFYFLTFDGLPAAIENDDYLVMTSKEL